MERFIRFLQNNTLSNVLITPEKIYLKSKFLATLPAGSFLPFFEKRSDGF